MENFHLTYHPKPNQRIWAGAYADSKVECFEVRSVYADDSLPYIPYWHKQFPLGRTLADFLYADLSAWKVHLKSIQEIVAQINHGYDIDAQFEKLFSYTSYWLKECALFVPLAAAIERLHLVYQQGQPLTTDELERCMEYYQALQPRLQKVVHTVLEADIDDDMTAKERYYEARARDKETFPELHFGQVQVQYLMLGGSQFYGYDDPAEAVIPSKADEPLTFAVLEAVASEEPSDIVDYILNRCLDANLEFRTCKYCGRYFGAKRGSKGEYCDRLIFGSTKTCKQAGSLRLYEKRKQEDPAIKAYKRAYKTHNARIRYGIMTREEFNAWSVEAREKRDLCVMGKLSLEDFEAWLEHDKL